MKIYDATGRLVRDFPVDLCNQNKFVKSVYWNGRDKDGKPMPSGIYFVQLKVGDKFSQTKKLLLIK